MFFDSDILILKCIKVDDDGKLMLNMEYTGEEYAAGGANGLSIYHIVELDESFSSEHFEIMGTQEEGKQ